MHSLREVCAAGTSHLTWVRPGREQAYVLPLASELLAILDVRRDARAGWVQLYAGTAEAADGRWNFTRQGLFRRETRVRVEGSAAELGRVSASLVGPARLRLAGAHGIRWVTPAGPQAFWESEGERLLSFLVQSRELAGEPTGGELEIAAAAAALPQLSLLVLLGWYLTLVKRLEEQFGLV